MVEWGQHGGLGWGSQITICLLLWCQHGWLSGVSTVGWAETQKSQFLVPVVSAWMVEWGQHSGLGWDSEITISGSCGVSMDGWVGSAWWVGVQLTDQNVFVAGGSARRRWQERYHEALPSLSTVLAWSVAGDYDFDKGIAPIISLFDGVFVAALRVLGSSMWRGYGYTETFIRTLNIVATLIIIDICQYVHIVDDCRCMTMKLQLINKPRNTNVRILHDCTRFVHGRSMEQPRKRYQYDRRIMEFEFLWATIPVLSRMIVSASEYFCIDFVVCHRIGDAEMSSWICSLRISGANWDPGNQNCVN